MIQIKINNEYTVGRKDVLLCEVDIHTNEVTHYTTNKPISNYSSYLEYFCNKHINDHVITIVDNDVDITGYELLEIIKGNMLIEYYI